MKIAIIGGGWYGCHLALVLQKAGYDVTIFEKNSDILNGVSGNFGIRLHLGPHYQSSPVTRKTCIETFEEFYKIYPEFVVHHDYSIYAHGLVDSLGNPSKVTKDHFEQVCQETPSCEKIELENSGYKGLDSIMNFNEPSIVIGKRLREQFETKLKNAGVKVVCNYTVQNIESQVDKTIIHGSQGNMHIFDYAINATGYQAFLPKDIKDNFPVEMEVVYQPCLALKYEDKTPGPNPFSFIVMDGWFPCLMPCVEDTPFKNQYILTHGAYTILASCDTPEKANNILNKLTDSFVEKEIKTRAEGEMSRFWPEFSGRFEYQDWKKAVLAKIRTKTEFRSAVTFASDRIIHIIPGKISNVLNVGPEVESLLADVNCTKEGNIRFMVNGVLDQARTEIETKPSITEPNTCNLNTYAELTNNQSNLATYSFFNNGATRISSSSKHSPVVFCQ